MCIWNFKLDSLLKAFSQRLHRYGFSPVWMSTWFRKLPFWWKPFPQMSQMNSFSSLWVRMCVFSVEDRLKALSQMWHLWGFSDVWIILWRQRVLDNRNPLPHMAHTNGLAPVWDGIFRWMVKVYFVLKILPHWSHLYGCLVPPVWHAAGSFFEPSRWFFGTSRLRCWDLFEIFPDCFLSFATETA